MERGTQQGIHAVYSIATQQAEEKKISYLEARRLVTAISFLSQYALGKKITQNQSRPLSGVLSSFKWEWVLRGKLTTAKARKGITSKNSSLRKSLPLSESLGSRKPGLAAPNRLLVA